MERGSRILVFLALFGLLYFFFFRGNGEADTKRKIESQEVRTPEGERPPAEFCDLWTSEYRAQISSRGGAVTSLQPLTAKYKKGKQSLELVTTPDHPHLGPLYTGVRSLADKSAEREWLIPTDVQDFSIVETTPSSCKMVSETDRYRLEKSFTVGKTPYSMEVTVKVTNLSPEKHSYALTMGTASYLIDAEVESKMFRMNPKMAHVECVPQDSEDVTRRLADDFDEDDFEDKERFPANSVNPGDWAQPASQASIVAVSDAYFTTSVAHDDGPAAPACLLQVDQRWRGPSKKADPLSGAIYQARLAYEPRELKPGASESYRFKAFIGPKERKALAAAGARFEPLIDLGFFSMIAKVLVGYLLWLYEIIPSWGVAIVLLTITARLLLFPLTWPSIKNMVHMRELKPEMDKLNEKYKDDPQAKGLAQMELWKKHGVNPMKGCLPQLMSMPVWFALYTTLQTAVELYNIPFLWFPDLSEPDPYYALPFVIGAVFFAQQKMMPMQGGDPAQQKMMLYFMPGMFTVFMLFLPAGLGVYMFTNSLLGIGQQQLVEIHARRTLADRRARAEVTQTPESQKRKKNKRS
jgi:YidC/Oxa1 family membrane protein insertase